MSLVRLRPCMNLCLNTILKCNYTKATQITSKSFNITQSNGLLVSLNSELIKKEYKCPSTNAFKLPLIDLQINDFLIKHELKLPQINNQKELIDPIFQIEKYLPQTERKNQNITYECNTPLMSVLKYRKRRMNRHKKKRYLKKMQFVIAKRLMRKEKRYEKLKALYATIFEKRTEAFDPAMMVYRELEKAKFWGYKVSNVYDELRNFVNNNMNPFPEEYFRKFEVKRGYQRGKPFFSERLYAAYMNNKKQK